MGGEIFNCYCALLVLQKLFLVVAFLVGFSDMQV